MDDGRNGVTATVTQSLAELRRSLANAWLEMTPEQAQASYAGRAGKIHRMVHKAGLIDGAATSSDIAMIADLGARLTAGSKPDPGLLLASILYLAPHKFPRFADIADVPAWLIRDYVDHMLSSPPMFHAAGEADAYCAFMARWTAHMRDTVAADPVGDSGHRLAAQFVATTQFHSLYFNAANVRDTFQARAELLEMSQGGNDTELDHQFPPRAAGGRLRVGVLSFNFSEGAETFATLPLIRHLDRTRFEVTLYALRQKNSAIEQFCAKHADRFVHLPRDLAARVQTMRADNLDMLYLGTNLTATAHELTLLALHRLARVQIAGVCSCVTTGMRNVDCYLSGQLSEPADAQAHYSEKLYRIDGPAHCYDFGGSTPAALKQEIRREDFAIPRDAIVFASGANFYKILPELDDIWFRIMASVPDSRLLLYPFNPQWNHEYPIENFMARLAARLQRHSIAPQRLLVFNTARSRADIMQRLGIADIYLDSFPFSGATSLLDPLLAGLPPVVLDGTTFRSRVGPGILRGIGLDELVAGNIDEYIRLAVRLAANREMRDGLAKKIGAAMRAMPSIFDGKRYGAEVSAAFEQMWLDYGAGLLNHR